jgi:hypothetical protein
MLKNVMGGSNHGHVHVSIYNAYVYTSKKEAPRKVTYWFLFLTKLFV